MAEWIVKRKRGPDWVFTEQQDGRPWHLSRKLSYVILYDDWVGPWVAVVIDGAATPANIGATKIIYPSGTEVDLR